MPNILLQQLENALSEGMQIPEELRKLYQWIEDNGYYEDRDGVRYGYLYPQDKLRDSWTDDEREGGTDISFYVLKHSDREELLEISYGKHKEEVRRRLLPFTRSGGDGRFIASRGTWGPFRRLWRRRSTRWRAPRPPWFCACRATP